MSLDLDGQTQVTCTASPSSLWMPDLPWERVRHMRSMLKVSKVRKPNCLALVGLQQGLNVLRSGRLAVMTGIVHIFSRFW